jgi:hypothetical protein
MPSKGTTKQRGYGSRHRDLRKAWKRIVEAGGAVCARCGKPIAKWELFDLDHRDDRRGYLGVSHRACNRDVSALRGSRHSRVW